MSGPFHLGIEAGDHQRQVIAHFPVAEAWLTGGLGLPNFLIIHSIHTSCI